MAKGARVGDSISQDLLEVANLGNSWQAQRLSVAPLCGHTEMWRELLFSGADSEAANCESQAK